MTRFSSIAPLGIAIWALAACGSRPHPASAPAADAPTAAAPYDDLNRIVERYWDAHVPAGNPLSAQYLADSLDVERRFLTEMLALPRARLDAQGQLTYDIFKRRRERNIDGLTYPSELMPLDPFEGEPQQLALTASDIAQHPKKTVKDYEDYQLAVDAQARWMRQAVQNMREGLRRGYTSPKILMERMLPLLRVLGSDAPDNVFYGPARTLPPTIGEPDRTRLERNIGEAVKKQLLPAYRDMQDFIQKEYLPRARASIALSALPLGRSWYLSLVRRAAGPQATPAEIHALGVAEVERLHARLAALPAASAPAGTAQPETLNAVEELKQQTVAAMAALFADAPPSDVELHGYTPLGEGFPLLYYRPARESGAPAVLYVNTKGGAAPAKAEVTAFLMEAIPGRHYQSALQQQRSDLPRVRRFDSDAAFTDGWALYAASLGEELGMFRDDASKRGAVMAQMKCAAALVADTGIHAENWTRTQAAAYLRAQLPAEAAAADVMTDEFIASPGSALGCKVGELKIRALRSRALERLGSRFDIREFHSEILKDGSMPLDILESKINLWMTARR